MNDDLLLDRDLKSETVKEPAKQWRNWARAGQDGFHARCSLCGAVSYYAPGELLPAHCRTHPSKDTAETYAAETMRGWRQAAEYLGAFPEGERP
jgi:hypothetical protein